MSNANRGNALEVPWASRGGCAYPVSAGARLGVTRRIPWQVVPAQTR